MLLQNTGPFIVTVAREPAPELTIADVVIGSLGLAGVLLLASLVLGGVVGFLLVRWHRRHPPADNHPPSVRPLLSASSGPPPSRVP